MRSFNLREAATRSWRGLLTSALLAVCPQLVQAQAIQVTPLRCEQGLHLTAKDARMSQVLKQLSSTLGFSLSFWAADDPLISFDGNVQSLQLIRLLAQQANIMFSTIPDARCPGQKRLQAVWVVPDGAGVMAQPVRRASPAVRPLPVPVTQRSVAPAASAPAAPVPPEEDSSTN